MFNCELIARLTVILTLSLSLSPRLGVAMLFSAGTFLFVVQHVLNETMHEKQLRLKELVILVLGCFLPSLLTVNHHH